MTTFEEYAASRPKPIVDAPKGYYAAMFVLMRHYDKWGYTEMRDEMAAHLQRKALRLAEAKQQEVKPG